MRRKKAVGKRIPVGLSISKAGLCGVQCPVCNYAK